MTIEQQREWIFSTWGPHMGLAKIKISNVTNVDGVRVFLCYGTKDKQRVSFEVTFPYVN